MMKLKMAINKSARRIGATHAGTSYHRQALELGPFARQIDQLIYAPELPTTELDKLDVLIVTDRTPEYCLRQALHRLLHFVDHGGELWIMGENLSSHWLPGVNWQSTETNYWWWLEANGDNGICISDPQHGLFDFLDQGAVTWHFHGLLQVPVNGQSLVHVQNPNGQVLGTVLYEQQRSEGGKLYVSTLDPFYHHGSHFMPATSRFLTGFFEYLNRP
ncbi:MAG: hypothetical protein ACTH58_16640 [Marinomonas foliarum]|uniref:hypothetical protein n=1 Tax=Marinomonas foliarum TaxID=491950 RepID=UPI003F947A9A